MRWDMTNAKQVMDLVKKANLAYREYTRKSLGKETEVKVDNMDEAFEKVGQAEFDRLYQESGDLPTAAKK